MKKRISIYLSEEEYEELKKKAEEFNMKPSAFIAKIVDENIDMLTSPDLE